MKGKIGEEALALHGNGSASLVGTPRRATDLMASCGKPSLQQLCLDPLQPDKPTRSWSFSQWLLDFRQKEIGGDLNVETPDKIYDKCKNTALGRSSGSSSTYSPPARSSEPVNIEKLQGTYFTTGVRKGRSFKEIYGYEKSYVKTIVAKFKNDNIKDRCLVQFAKYCSARQEREESDAYMVQDEDRSSEEIYVILDTGCNNACHGSRWMEKFVNYMGMQPELQPAEGRFRGVGGKVEVAGKRTIPVCMKTLGEELVPGNITSIELENSSADLCWTCRSILPTARPWTRSWRSST